MLGWRYRQSWEYGNGVGNIIVDRVGVVQRMIGWEE